MAAHNELGQWGEQLAANYLAGQGYIIHHTDWRLGHRDIDIVATDPETQELVFVEVKTRSSDRLIDPEAAVNYAKMKSLSYAANAYIKTFRIDNPCRFDVLTIVGTPGSDYKIKQIKEAFNPMLLRR